MVYTCRKLPIFLYFFLATNDFLKVLDLSWNHLRLRGATAIGRALQVCFLQKQANLPTTVCVMLGAANIFNLILRLLSIKEEFEDTKGAAIICKSEKDRHHNGQQKKDRHHNGQQKKDRHHNGQRKRTKGRTTIYKKLHTKLKIEYHEPHLKPGVNLGTPEELSVPALLVPRSCTLVTIVVSQILCKSYLIWDRQIVKIMNIYNELTSNTLCLGYPSGHFILEVGS